MGIAETSQGGLREVLVRSMQPQTRGSSETPSLKPMKPVSPLLIVWLTVCWSAGCATLEIPWLNQVPEASAKNPVVKILSLWEPSEGRDPQGLPCRGFAGQVLFLGNKGGTPVKVQGDVSIYVFDDFGTVEEQSRPLHVFEFKGGSWERHLKVGTLGPAYHVFVPYTRPGGYEANCSIRIKYLPADGSPVVFSDPSNLPLKGKPRPVALPASPAPSPAEDAGPNLPPPPQVRTTSIPLDPARADSPISPLAETKTRQILESFLQQQLNHSDATPESDERPRLRFDGQRVKRLYGSGAASEEQAVSPATAAPVSPEHPLFEQTPAN